MTRHKDYNLEFLRFIATIGVIFVHVGICWISANNDTATPLQRFTFSAVQHSTNWAVPVFMMITGALLMSKESITYKKAMKYFVRMGLLLILFGTVFAWMELFFTTHSFSVAMIGQGFVNMFVGETWKHLWYLYMLLGIYLILPALNRLSQLPPNLLIFTALVMLFTSLIPTFRIKIGIDFPIGSVYVGYFLTGYLLKSGGVDWMTKWKYTTVALWAVFVVTMLLMVVGVYQLVVNHYDIGFEYSSYISIFTVLQSCALFVLCNKRPGMFDKFCGSALIKRFNRCSLGIYIIHMVWINIIIKVLHVNIMPYGLLCIIPMGIVVYVLSWLTVEMMVRMPILKKYL